MLTELLQEVGKEMGVMFADAGLPLALASITELNIRKLHAGRVDLVPAVETVGWDVIRRTFPEEDHARSGVMEAALDVCYNYLMTLRHYPQTEQLLEEFNQALNTMQRKGVSPLNSTAAPHRKRIFAAADQGARGC